MGFPSPHPPKKNFKSGSEVTLHEHIPKVILQIYWNKIVDHTLKVFTSSTALMRADPHVYDLESQSARNARDLGKVSGVL